MLDFEEDYLISLCMKYRDSFEELNQTMEVTGLTQEYGRGGCTLHRGFYCPSPVEDIIVGGCDRGRLVHKLRSNLSQDYVFLKEGDKLRIVDKYELDRNNIPYIHQREFIIDNGAEDIAPKFDMGPIACFSTSHDLSFLSLCRYDALGRIIKYLTILPSFSFAGDKVLIDKKGCYFTGEQYSYNEQTGLLDTVVHGTKMNHTFEYSYRFIHDETGRVVAYQNIERGTLREIAKRKQRLV